LFFSLSSVLLLAAVFFLRLPPLCLVPHSDSFAFLALLCCHLHPLLTLFSHLVPPSLPLFLLTLCPSSYLLVLSTTDSGGAQGDPHFTNFNGCYFDFQVFFQFFLVSAFVVVSPVLEFRAFFFLDIFPAL